MLGFITSKNTPSGLERREFDEPDPRPDEAVVEVHAYSVSRGEIDLLRMRPDGFRPGQEGAGVVVRAAADGSGPPAGTRVAGLAHGGTWSERVAIPTQALGRLPDDVTAQQGTAFAGSGLMAFRAIRHAGELEDRRVLICGAGGSVGFYALQLARAAGAEVTAVVSGEHRIAPLTRFGVEVLASLPAPGQAAYDLVLDGVGGPLLAPQLRLLAPGGLALTYGGVTGQPAQIIAADFRNAPGGSLQGFFLWQTDNATFWRDLEALGGLVAAGKLETPIGLELDWSKTAEAVRAIRDREVVGKSVLTIQA